MQSLQVAAAVLGLTTVLFACPLSVSCPADNAEMHKVGETFSGQVRMAIFEHRTSAGTIHQITVPCGK